MKANKAQKVHCSVELHWGFASLIGLLPESLLHVATACAVHVGMPDCIFQSDTLDIPGRLKVPEVHCTATVQCTNQSDTMVLQ